MKTKNRSKDAARRATADPDVPKNGKAKQERVDLGLAILDATRQPGVPYSLNDIAAYARLHGYVRHAAL